MAQGITGAQPVEEGAIEQIPKVEESGPDKPVPPPLSDEQREGRRLWLTQVKNPVMEDSEGGETVLALVVSAGGDHAGPSATSERNCHGKVNSMNAERGVRRKGRGWG